MLRANAYAPLPVEPVVGPLPLVPLEPGLVLPVEPVPPVVPVPVVLALPPVDEP